MAEIKNKGEEKIVNARAGHSMTVVADRVIIKLFKEDLHFWWILWLDILQRFIHNRHRCTSRGHRLLQRNHRKKATLFLQKIFQQSSVLRHSISRLRLNLLWTQNR